MRAVRLHGPSDLRVDDVRVPDPQPGEVQIRNAFAGICGSDIHLFLDPASMIDLEHPHPVTGSTFPQILGHEFSGTISALGEGVAEFSQGQQVTVWPIYGCGRCVACRRDIPNVCRSISFHGVASNGGGMAEFTTVPASAVFLLPDIIPLRVGALVEPLAVAWHAVERAAARPGQSVLIAGAGPIGIALAWALRARGVDRVVVSEPSAERRGAVQEMGVLEVIDPMTADLAARVSAITGGDGVDIFFDASGVGAAVTGGLSALAPRGRAVIVALHGRDLALDLNTLVMSEVEVLGSLAYSRQDFADVIRELAAHPLEELGWVQDVSLGDVERTIHELRSGRGEKSLVRLDLANV